MKLRLRIKFILVGCAVLFSSTGCDFEYWTTRGQPPSVEQLLNRAQNNLAVAQQSRASARKELALVAAELEPALIAATETLRNGVTQGSGRNQEQLNQQISKARNGFMALEGKVSIGSRAALGQLSGQFRTLSAQAQTGSANYIAFGLFAARTLNFLAGEFEVPAPSFG